MGIIIRFRSGVASKPMGSPNLNAAKADQATRTDPLVLTLGLDYLDTPVQCGFNIQHMDCKEELIKASRDLDPEVLVLGPRIRRLESRTILSQIVSRTHRPIVILV